MSNEIEALKQQLRIYKHMLYDFENEKPYTNIGFCNWLFFIASKKGLWFPLLYELKELYSLKPKNKNNTDLWFEKGERQPRIELLKKAIAITEQKIKSYE